MTVSLKHAFTSGKTDGADATLVQPSNWNAEHQLTLANNTVLGRNAGTDGAAQELSGSDLRTLTGLAITDSPQFTAIELGHASDTTLSRSAAGKLAVEGVDVVLTGGALGTPSSGTLTNCTSLPVSGITASTSTALGVGSIELGHASDTTISRASAGVIAVEGNNVLTSATGQPLDATLTALAAYNTNGVLAQIAADTFAGRTITGTADQITVTNGDGVAGNPTISLPSDLIVPSVITAPNTGLHILDTNASHDLIIKPGSDLTADRTLTVTTGDADRALVISGDATVSQDYSTSASPQFAALNVGHASDTTVTRASAGVIAVEGSNVILASNKLSALSATTSAELANVISDETGSGALVFATTPTFATSTLHPAGSASAPSVAASGDIDTGIWFPAADTIAASTAGTERLRIDASGNIGINTTTIDAALTVNGAVAVADGAAATPSLTNTGDLDTGIWFPAANTLAFSTNGTEKMRLRSGGALCLNTTSSSAGDYIAINIGSADGGFTVTNAAGTGSPYIRYVNAGNSIWYCAINASDSAYKIRTSGTDYASGTDRFSLSSTGDVTIGGSFLTTGSTGGIGYATGSGGAVTQTTSRTTGVTLNKINGAITLVSAAGSTTWNTFTVTNSAVAATDTIIVNQKSGSNLYEIQVTAVAAGSFNLSFRTTGGTTTEQPVFNFAVIKAVAA